MKKKNVWLLLMVVTLGFWIMVIAGGQLLFPENQLKAWAGVLVLFFIHASEIFVSFKIGKAAGLSSQRIVIKTLLFGFTWWVPLQKGILTR